MKQLFNDKKYQEIINLDCLEVFIIPDIEKIIDRKRKSYENKSDLIQAAKKLKNKI